MRASSISSVICFQLVYRSTTSGSSGLVSVMQWPSAPNTRSRTRRAAAPLPPCPTDSSETEGLGPAAASSHPLRCCGCGPCRDRVDGAGVMPTSSGELKARQYLTHGTGDGTGRFVTRSRRRARSGRRRQRVPRRCEHREPVVHAAGAQVRHVEADADRVGKRDQRKVAALCPDDTRSPRCARVQLTLSMSAGSPHCRSTRSRRRC